MLILPVYVARPCVSISVKSRASSPDHPLLDRRIGERGQDDQQKRRPTFCAAFGRAKPVRSPKRKSGNATSYGFVIVR
jgi:hypothetical protein